MSFGRYRAGAASGLSHHVPIWLLAALVFAAIWFHTYRLIGEDRARTLDAAQKDIANMARISQEHAERIFFSADQTLLHVLGEYREHKGKIDFKEMAEEGIFDTHILLQIGVVDAHGILQQSYLPWSGSIDLSNQEQFKVHLKSGSVALFISRPAFERAAGKWSVQLSRRISGKNGEFGGVVVASLDPGYFSRFFAEFALGKEGVAALYGVSGALLAKRTASQEIFDGDDASSSMFSLLAKGDKTGALTSREVIDGIERVYHFKKLPSYPLLVLIGMSGEDALSGHRLTKARLVREAVILSLMLLALAVLSSWYVMARRRHSVAQLQALAQLQSLTDCVPGVVYKYLQRPDGSYCFPFASEGLRDVFRLSPQDVVLDGSRVSSLIHPDDLADVKKSIQTSAQALALWEHEFRVRFQDGTVRWLSSYAAPQRLADGSVLWHGFTSDVTERKLAAENLRIAAIAFESEEGMFITDTAGVILRVNQSFSRITGYAAVEAIGKTPSLLSSGRHDKAFYAAMRKSIEQNGSWQGEIWNRRKNGEIFPEWLTITAVKDDEGAVTHYVSNLADITKRKAAEEEIRRLAFYDPLTGLPNRRLLTDRLRHALAINIRYRRNGALLFIDLDNFKKLNDTHGPDQGDLLLRQVAERLTHCVREGGTVACLGGDDFVVMLQDLSDSQTEAATLAEAMGQKILLALRQPYQFSHFTYHGSASVGVALFNVSHDSVDELFKRADVALYQAKDAGRNTLRFFDPEMQIAINERAELEADLRCGLQEKQFLLYYQPQVDQQGDLTGVEALVRWLHPRRGMVSPVDFIPLAEDTKLILPLGQWVLETACLQLKAWATHPQAAHLTIAVNISALQLHRESFVQEVIETVKRTGAPSERLKLELTESLLVRDIEHVIEKMLTLKAQGVGFSLDDFGTGYSSLSYLKRLPLDQLKIDQSFLHEALSNPKDAAIVRATVALGKSLGLMVIAEGVETQAQRDFLEREGCHNFQGYYFGRPAPVAALERFFTMNKPA